MHHKEETAIYLDYAAAAPVRTEVAEQVPEFLKDFANPSSIHKAGVTVRAAVARARKDIAALLGALPEEVVFTSGSTEALNIAIQGIAREFKSKLESPHIVTSSIEHPAVLETLKSLRGVKVTYLDPDPKGVVSPQDIQDALCEETVLIVFSYVNSEIGSIAPISEYVRVLRNFRRRETGESYPYFLLDVTQAAICFEVNVQKLGIDMLVLDGAKFGGLKGGGAMYVSRNVAISPILFGGGQEFGLRPGTPNVLAIESFREAFASTQSEAKSESERLSELSGSFIELLKREIPQASINGASEPKWRAPHIVSVCFSRVDAEWLVIALDAKGIAVSRGSACKSGKGNESEVLRVVRPNCAESSIRFSFGRNTTQEEIRRLVSALKELIV